METILVTSFAKACRRAGTGLGAAVRAKDHRRVIDLGIGASSDALPTELPAASP